MSTQPDVLTHSDVFTRCRTALHRNEWTDRRQFSDDEFEAMRTLHAILTRLIWRLGDDKRGDDLPPLRSRTRLTLRAVRKDLKFFVDSEKIPILVRIATFVEAVVDGTWEWDDNYVLVDTIAFCREAVHNLDKDGSFVRD